MPVQENCRRGLFGPGRLPATWVFANRTVWQCSLCSLIATGLSVRVSNTFNYRTSEVAELVDQARDVVNGLSTDELMQDANLRKYIADEMNHLRISVDGAL
jgi:hypothetical protein